MKKSDIDTHGERGRIYPAINVKVYRMGWNDETVSEHFKCSPETASKAARYSFESAQEQFWEDVKEEAHELFGNVGVYSGGRSGGWLEVHDLPELEYWNAIMVSKWARLEKWVREEIAYLTSWDYHREAIESNQWAKDGAEKFNFTDRNGKTECIADLKAAAVAAGFAPVVRK